MVINNIVISKYIYLFLGKIYFNLELLSIKKFILILKSFYLVLSKRNKNL